MQGCRTYVFLPSLFAAKVHILRSLRRLFLHRLPGKFFVETSCVLFTCNVFDWNKLCHKIPKMYFFDSGKRLQNKFSRAVKLKDWDKCRIIIRETPYFYKRKKIDRKREDEIIGQMFALVAQYSVNVPLDIVRSFVDLHPESVRYREPGTMRYPLHLFVLSGARLEVIRIVADAYLPALSAVDLIKSQTPLHLACHSHSVMPSVVDFLCKVGLCAVGMEDLDGNVPMEVLIEYGDSSDSYSHSIMMDILHTYGAEYWARKRQTEELFRITRRDSM